eukprot:3088647-Pleurochrysis_carterae.AAC.1
MLRQSRQGHSRKARPKHVYWPGHEWRRQRVAARWSLCGGTCVAAPRHQYLLANHMARSGQSMLSYTARPESA